MITKLPEAWHIVVTEDSINHINAFKASGRAYSTHRIQGSIENPYASGQNFEFQYFGNIGSCIQGSGTFSADSTELTLEEFRILVVGDLKISMKEKIKLLKI